ncbi:MAG TPA: CehA/McbA family metallohydrolase [Acidimicrobiales bacterium]|nr:CehA/McbA family metallohydrolase [Acidimicrobiales bacterium]
MGAPPAVAAVTRGRYVERPVPRLVRWPLSVLATLGAPTSRILESWRGATYEGPPPACEPDGRAVELRGTAFPGDARTYRQVPFEVRPGTARLEISYSFEPLGPTLPDNPVTQTVFDLGLWDEQGYRDARGFRGWSGSRHRTIFVEADRAERCYRPGPINPGIWYVELGFAAVGPTGAEWTVTVRAFSGPSRPPPTPDPVDAAHVANPEPGWYHGDFHMHAYHSNPKGPTRERFVEWARLAHLDFTPVTEYVVGLHWDQYGQAQRENRDLVIWPGREIITYFGHMQCLGETPGFIEYRHGFEDVHVRDIQSRVRSAGALFQVNHPTTFAGSLFSRVCRGCAFELGDEIEWDEVDTIEVLNQAAVVRKKLLRGGYVEIENPFMGSAIRLWESKLNDGYRITAVSGSDAKLGKGLGSSATAVFAEQLSRHALIEAIRAGRAYIRTLGVADSPELNMTVTAADGQAGTFGSRLVVEVGGEVQVTVAVKGGSGQWLRVIRNGAELDVVRVTSDEFSHDFTARRVAREHGLDTWYRVETFDDRSRTTIGNPVYLGPLRPAPPRPLPLARRPVDRARRNVRGLLSARSLAGEG